MKTSMYPSPRIHKRIAHLHTQQSTFPIVFKQYIHKRIAHLHTQRSTFPIVFKKYKNVPILEHC